jgi:thiamine biosynthesis lipoprotein
MIDLVQRYILILKDAVKRYMKSGIQWINSNKWILLLPLLALYIVVMSKRNSKLIQLSNAKQKQGRNYSIQYIVGRKTNYQKEIDNLLDEMEQALDINKSDSEVVTFNQQNSEPFYYQTPFLYPLLVKSKEVYNQTQGAFDPTVAPLVKLWKESLQAGTRPTGIDIWSSRTYVGLDYIVLNEKRVKKLKEEVSINFNGLINSYQVDEIAHFLKSREIQDFYIQLNNEILVQGTNNRKKPWRILQKVATQESTDKPLDVHIHLKNKAVSIIRNHTTQEQGSEGLGLVIDPLSGRLATTNLIAAFVFAKDCVTARAYAIAFMAKSFLTASSIIERLGGMDFLLIYKDEIGTTKFQHSPGLKIQHTEGSNKVIIRESNKTSSSTAPAKSTD